MATTTQIYRDGIADWIDNRTSVGRDSVAFVIKTFVQRNGVICGRFRDRKSERSSFSAIHLSLKGGWFPLSVWLIFCGDQLLVWLSTRYSTGEWVATREPLSCLDLNHPDFFEHLRDFLHRFDVELPKFGTEVRVTRTWR